MAQANALIEKGIFVHSLKHNDFYLMAAMGKLELC
jgi:hypothetical protein